ncbi:hypothetical protein PYCCODRAFT_1430847 [Trametes coccinea BRFM310]|uniref:Uncharacterized protein n=1 Tax=Trametes coccinea (strain BRFM310) TaxID=1353009 RepID=A0A1Y2J2G0_TRAC3|nr:hypothetical protein PYCCODRAFT_1430847 [Trametes coccinea BRFM310]
MTLRPNCLDVHCKVAVAFSGMRTDPDTLSFILAGRFSAMQCVRILACALAQPTAMFCFDLKLSRILVLLLSLHLQPFRLRTTPTDLLCTHVDAIGTKALEPFSWVDQALTRVFSAPAPLPSSIDPAAPLRMRAASSPPARQSRGKARLYRLLNTILRRSTSELRCAPRRPAPTGERASRTWPLWVDA